MTKAAGELLVTDYTRKGFVDGRVARLPTVIIRPGRPNAAASGFASGLFREPLAGVDSVVPVPLETPMVLISTGCAVAGMAALLAHGGDDLGVDRVVNLPALAVTVADMLAALDATGRATGRVTVAPDPAIEAVVATWPGRWQADRASALGLPADTSLADVVDQYLADPG
jgi:nucleoside-diphosphate-sugar epimerase